MLKSIKNLAVAVVALGAFSLTACMSSGTSTAPGEDKNATVFVRANMKNVNTLSKPGLAKLTPIALTTLRITATSDVASPKTLGADSVVVTYTVGDTLSGNDTLSHLATSDQNFDVELSLRPLRSWTIKVETIDDESDVIQSGTSNLGTLFAGQVKAVSVTAVSLFHNYTATFNFSDIISSATGTISGQDLFVTQISMQIGADVASYSTLADTVVNYTFDTLSVDPLELDTLTRDTVYRMIPDTNHVLNIYKVDTLKAQVASLDSVYLNVYGYLPQGPDSGGTALDPILLYTKTKKLSQLNLLSATEVTLDWVGPTTGTAGMTIVVSKVGTLEITATTPPVVID